VPDDGGSVPSAIASALPGQTTTASPGATAEQSPRESEPTLPSLATWREVKVAGASPAAREDHTWTVAEDGRTAYLFGGRGGGEVFGDLWSFDLVAGSWQRIEAAGDAPPARFGHDAVWVAGRGLVIFAGQGDRDFFNDLWVFDPATARWQRLPDGGDVPVPRYGSCSGLGPDARLWISHGFTEDGVRFADTKAYDFDAATWADEAPLGDGPIQRCLHACWWTADGRLALYGGQTTGVPALGDLWFLTPGPGGPRTNTWTALPDPGPPARQLAAVAQRGPITFLYGGRGVDRKALGDLWLRLDASTMGFVSLTPGGTPPAARSGATLIADPARARLLLFGGLGDEPFADVWELDIDA